MAFKRPLEPLQLTWWGNGKPAFGYTLVKEPCGPGVFTLFGTRLNAQEARDIHAWLGKLIEDLDAGV